MRSYELTFIVRPDISEDDVNATVKQVQDVITGLGNQVVKLNRWGRRRLAYPIKNQREGHYVLFEVSIIPGTIGELERNLKFNDTILRYLLVRADD